MDKQTEEQLVELVQRLTKTSEQQREKINMLIEALRICNNELSYLNGKNPKMRYYNSM